MKQAINGWRSERWLCRHNKLVVDVGTLEYVAACLREAMRHMRKMADKPLEPYKKPGPLEEIDYAGKNLLDAAERLGIDMGAGWQDQLDLREKG